MQSYLIACHKRVICSAKKVKDEQPSPFFFNEVLLKINLPQVWYSALNFVYLLKIFE